MVINVVEKTVQPAARELRSSQTVGRLLWFMRMSVLSVMREQQERVN